MLLLAVTIPLGIHVLTIKVTEAERKLNVRHMKRAFLWFSWGYTVFLICGSLAGLLIGFTSTYGNLLSVGCNFHDALLYGISCRGFFGAQAVQVLVGFPLLVVQFSFIFFPSSIGFVFVLLLWLPVMVSLYSLTKCLTSHCRGRSASGAPLS